MQPNVMQPLDLIGAIGVAGIGFVFGYLLYYTFKHSDKIDAQFLMTAIGTVGGQSVLAWVGKFQNWIGPYGIGLFLGFLTYFIVVCILNIEDRAALIKTLLGKSVE